MFGTRWRAALGPVLRPAAVRRRAAIGLRTVRRSALRLLARWPVLRPVKSPLVFACGTAMGRWLLEALARAGIVGALAEVELRA